jgi:hypothetical protein
MDNVDPKLDRLLRSAAQAGDDAPGSAPFGFDTRVVALWRAGAANANGNGVAHLLRRVAILATIVIVISTAAALREFKQSRETFGEPMSNEFALADSAIQEEFSQ